MYKKTFLIFIFLIATLVQTPLATADFLVANGSASEDAWVIYSTWHSASAGWPAGYRTQGWYRIEPGGTQNLFVPENNTLLYIRVEDPSGNEIKPLDHATRDSSPFWMHPTRIFTAVETNEGEFLDSDLNRASLRTATLYKYTNEGIHIITKRTDCDPVQGPADLPAQQIYDRAINSVLWIDTDSGHGSGVLIDQERRLAVTNQHVTEDNAWVDVYFPGRGEDGRLVRDMEYYRTNYRILERIRYATKGRVIAKDSVNDVAIIQLDQLSPIAQEIDHDFSMQVDMSMRRGDKVHILGNPGNRLWNWTQGTFLGAYEDCLPKGGACLYMEGDAEGGNSGGPILNGQGVLIGILTAGTDDTVALASPLKSIKALLDTVGPKYTFRIRNNAGFTLPYLVKWSDDLDWSQHFLDSGRGLYHWGTEDVIPSEYPKIAFDSIVNDGQVTWQIYSLDTFLRYFGDNYDNNVTADDANKYVFEYDWRSSTLDIYIDGDAAAPMISASQGTPGTGVRPKETVLLPNYPNPFNPETWIPYKLSKAAEVTVVIYAIDGSLIRTLTLGHQSAGTYQSKSRAAYWDGKNEVGEPVASGVYFYTLSAGEFTATRKMFIKK